MTFRESINKFQTDYNVLCLSNQIPEIKLNEKKVLFYISKAYGELSFTERLIEKKTDVRLVINQYEYTTGVGTSNIPKALLDIVQVRFNDGGSNMAVLEEVSYGNMPQAQRSGGIPNAWTLWGVNDARKLIIDTLPDQSYSSSNNYLLTIYYREKVFTFSGISEDSFSALDFTSSTGGGSFSNPTEWDDLIILKAICKILPVAIRNNYIMEAEKMELRLRQTKPLVVESKLPYYL